MIHNLTDHGAKVWITYDIDFIPATSPAASDDQAAAPDLDGRAERRDLPGVRRATVAAARTAKYTYPDDAKNPYHGGPAKNEWTVDHPGTIVGTAGHVHPGGLYDELDDVRAGATPSGGAIAGTVPHSVRLFRSLAHYFDPRGPISWDMAMTATAPDWRPHLNGGDTLRISATYETKRASWYEAMGIMVAWEAWDSESGGVPGSTDPFSTRPIRPATSPTGISPRTVTTAARSSSASSSRSSTECFTHRVIIGGFHYTPGDFTSTGQDRCTPTIRQGQSLTFVNNDSIADGKLSSALFGTSRRSRPRTTSTRSSTASPPASTRAGSDTGISYPLANGAGNYDSGQLGPDTPAIGNLSWSTPAGLKPGTYTYFCRIHPFMRGVFRVIR